jgi:hypothetical protein
MQGNSMKRIQNELEQNGYDYAVAIATQAEINAGAACGQLSIIIENNDNQ